MYRVSNLKTRVSRIRGVVANYLASQVRDPGIDSHQHLKDLWHIWRHLRRDTVFSCNLRFRLIFLHGCSRTHCVASLRAVPVGRISYNLYFDCKHVRSVTCDLINEYTFLSSLKTRVSSLRTRLSSLKTRVSSLKNQVSSFQTRYSSSQSSQTRYSSFHNRY